MKSRVRVLVVDDSALMRKLIPQLLQGDPSIEVVMITAYASLETVRHALTHGAFEYLIKPFSRQDLEDVVHRALVRRQADLFKIVSTLGLSSRFSC